MAVPMHLAAGTRLGSYTVVAPLGAGGMGEVYRARDTRLGREVALKVLPQSFAGDAERVARFRREAQVLASLNHTHRRAQHVRAGTDRRRVSTADEHVLNWFTELTAPAPRK
jgi:serine/threonine protein kinase